MGTIRKLDTPVMSHSATLLMSEFVTCDAKRFVISEPESFAFDRGGGVEPTIDEPKWRNEPRPFAPTALHEDQVLEFSGKACAAHDGVTQRLNGLDLGAELTISDPSATIRDAGKGVFTATGAGVTCKREFRHDLGERCLLTCTGESAPGDHANRVDREHLAANFDDFQPRFYLCGPPNFVIAAHAAPDGSGADSEALVVER